VLSSKREEEGDKVRAEYWICLVVVICATLATLFETITGDDLVKILLAVLAYTFGREQSVMAMKLRQSLVRR